MSESFEFNPTTRVIYGEGALGRLGELARELEGKNILLVTDLGVGKAGIADRAVASLEEAGGVVFLYDETRENPTTEDVERAVEYARARGGVDLIVGLGGGSAMDCAKGVNFILTNGGRMEDYHGMGKAKAPMLPSIGVPTTAGTGSEAQSFALIARADTHEKMPCGDLKARFHIVVLDPALTSSVPRGVTAATGVDAISHAVESYVSKRRNAISEMFAREAWKLLSSAFEQVLVDPDDGEARGQMLLGAHFAGAAIENAMLGAAHACANSLTAHYGITHGIAVGLMLPAVVRYNGETEDFLYEGLGSDAEGLASRIESLKEKANLPARLEDVEVDRSKLPQLAQEAAQQWTGTFNPRPVGEKDFLTLYESAF